MFNTDENKIHLLLKISPIFLILVSICITYYIIAQNNTKFEKELVAIKEDVMIKSKIEVEHGVEDIYDLIQDERNQAERKLKENIKKHVYQAHAIAMSIYKHNKGQPKHIIEIQIKNALRDIRFNNGNGYFFIYDLEGTNIMHPIVKEIEGKNLINLKDTQGTYVIQNSINIAKTTKEGFSKWWWTKPNDNKNEYEKMGFIKYFEPFNWYFGTGEYMVDWEESLKEKILSQVRKVDHHKNQYIVISDYSGKVLSHFNTNITDHNEMHEFENKGYVRLKEVIEVAKKGEKFIIYEDSSHPKTGIKSQKISFVKGLNDWKWMIVSSAYSSDVNKDIIKRQNTLNQKHEEQITNIMTINIVTFGVLFLFILYISITIKKIFDLYKKNVEEQRKELVSFNNNLENEVKKRTAQYQSATLDAQSANRAKSTFLANMSHEIRTPLNAILGFVNILSDNETDIEKSKYLKTIKSSSNSLLVIISDILDFAKIESGNMTLDIASVNPHLDFGDIGTLFFAKAEDINLKFNLYIDPYLPINIKIDSLKIRQILTNLLSNAMKFSSKEDTVSLKIKYNVNNNSILFSVRDTGIGIAKENHKKIFQSFSQELESTSTKYGGTGLGLAISSKMVELMGSKLKINSEVGKGSEFYFNLDVELSDDNQDRFLTLPNIKNIRVGLLYDTDNEQINTLKEYLESFGIDKFKLIENKEEVTLLEYPLLIINSDMYDNNQIQLFLDNGHSVIIIKTSLVKTFDNKFKGKIVIIDPPFNPSNIHDALLELFMENKEKLLKLDNTKSIEKKFNKNANILIAEDNNANQLFMKITMKKLGLNFSFANDGLEAISMFENGQYDLILMDENMPNMNGTEATKNILRIEKENNLKHTPIVALTANAIKGDRERFLKAGMDDYLTKPIDVKDLASVFMKFLPER